jgi:hypothetical protein
VSFNLWQKIVLITLALLALLRLGTAHASVPSPANPPGAASRRPGSKPEGTRFQKIVDRAGAAGVADTACEGSSSPSSSS